MSIPMPFDERSFIRVAVFFYANNHYFFQFQSKESMESLKNKDEKKKKTCLSIFSLILAFIGIILGISCFSRRV